MRGLSWKPNSPPLPPQINLFACCFRVSTARFCLSCGSALRVLLVLLKSCDFRARPIAKANNATAQRFDLRRGLAESKTHSHGATARAERKIPSHGATARALRRARSPQRAHFRFTKLANELNAAHAATDLFLKMPRLPRNP